MTADEALGPRTRYQRELRATRRTGGRIVSIETLREKLAALAHDQWSGWMRYLYTRTMPCSTGGDIIPLVWSERWQRQMDTAYQDLTEAEKESDRREADRVLAILAHLQPSPDLRGLVEQWRQRSANESWLHTEGRAASFAFDQCANDLEAAIATMPKPK